MHAISTTNAFATADYTVRPWPVNQRLNQQTILSILQASNDTLWIATLAGLDRFDGNSITSFRPYLEGKAHIPSSRIVGIVQTTDGAIIVATRDAGLLLFHEEENRFLPMEWQNSDSNLTQGIASAFADTLGNIWIGYESGYVIRYTPASRELLKLPFKFESRIADFTQDLTGTTYIATLSGNLYQLHSISGNLLPITVDNNCFPENVELKEIAVTNDDNLWFGTSGSGFSLYDTESGKCVVPTIQNIDASKLASAHVHDIYYDRKSGTTWIGSDQGLYQILSDNSGTYFTAENSNLSENEIASIAPYRDGHLWIGTYRGLNYIVPTLFESHDEKFDRKLHSIVAISSSNESSTLIASYTGLLFFDSSANQHYELADSRSNWRLFNDQIMSLGVNGDGIWVGYRSNGLEFVPRENPEDIHSWRTGTSPSLSSDSVSAILFTSDERVFVGTYGGGLNIVSLQDQTKVYTVGNGRVIMLYETGDGTIWAGTESGLFYFNNSLDAFTKIEFGGIGNANETGPIVWDMIEGANGELWFATMHHGLFSWRPKRNRDLQSTLDPSFHHFSVSHRTVYAMEMDNQGNLWCSTDSGLLRINPRTRDIRVFSQQHGLQISEFDFGVSHKDYNGDLYFGGTSGYTKFSPQKLDTVEAPPDIKISRIILSDYSVDSRSKLNQISQLQLTHKDYFVQFDFSVLDFLDPEKNQYRYMLEGFDHNWINNGTRNSATYTSLPSGKYVLRIQGANSAGVWNREGVSLDIVVLPPPWLTWWAVTIYALIAVALFWIAKRVYDSYSIERRAKELAIAKFQSEERADDEMQEQLEIHDDLVKSMYRHSVCTLELISDVITAKGASLGAGTARDAADSSVRRVAALAQLEECLYYEGDVLLADLNKYVDILLPTLLDDAPVDAERVITINDVPSQPMAIELASPLAIALFELLENSIQHAFDDESMAHYLEISLSARKAGDTGSEYHLLVRDDGPGIPANIDPLTAQSPGLAIVSTMVRRLSGKLSFSANDGTLISIAFPVPE